MLLPEGFDITVTGLDGSPASQVPDIAQVLLCGLQTRWPALQHMQNISRNAQMGWKPENTA